MASPRTAVTHENLTILETETSTSEYSRSERTSDGVSTAYLPVNLFGQSPAAHTHDGGEIEYFDGDFEYDVDEDHIPKEDPLAAYSMYSAATSPTIIHGHGQDKVALWVNYTSIGVTQAMLQSIVYPYLKIYLNMDEYRAFSAELLIALPWSLKLVVALASDYAPIRGLRRKPYLYIGWALCGIFALTVSCIPSETPYLKHGQVTNREAADAGSKYIGLFIILSLGVVIADTVCDGIVVELSHREPESKRGTVLLTAMTSRYAGHAGMTFLAALLCNSKPYGGDFGWGASPNQMWLFVVAATLVASSANWFYLVEEVRQRRTQPSQFYHPSRASTLGDDHRNTPAPTLTRASDRPRRSSVTRAQRLTLWKYFQRRSTLQIALYVFLARVCFSYYASSNKVLYETWLSISPLLSNIINAVNALVFVAVAILLKSSHLLTSWKRLIQGAVVISVLLTIIPLVFIVTDVVRNGILTLLVEQLVAFVEALAYYAILLAILEVTESNGLEATSFALFTSLANAAIPFATSLSQSIGAHFDAYDSEWVKDTSSVRWKMIYAFLMWVVFRAANFALLPLLPEQKRDMYALKSFGGAHRLAALYVGGAAMFVLLWAPFTTILAAFETTACLTVAGGEGC